MRINNQGFTPITFDDVCVIDDDRGFAVFHDIEEEVGSRPPGQSILSSRGSFIYELKYYIESVYATQHKLHTMIVNVYDSNPAQDYNKNGADNAASHRKNILNYKNRQNKDPGLGQNNNLPKKPKPIMKSQFSLAGAIQVGQNNQPPKSNDESNKGNSNNSKKADEHDAVKKQEYSFYGSKEFVKDEHKIVVVDVKKSNLDGIDNFAAAPYSKNNPKYTPDKIKDSDNQNSRKPNKENSKSDRLDLIFKHGLDASIVSNVPHPVPSFADQKMGAHDAKPTRNNGSLLRDPISHEKKGVHERSGRSNGIAISINGASVDAHKHIGNYNDSRLNSKIISDLIDSSIIVDKNLDKEKGNAKEDKDSPVIAKIQSHYVEFIKSIAIDMKIAGLSDNLYFEVSLVDKDDDILFTKTFIANHKESLDNYLIPEAAPTIGVGSQSRGYNSITINQHDPIACKIILQKRTLNPNMEYMDVPFNNISSFKLTPDMGTFTFEDDEADNIQPNVIIYRAIAVGPTGQQGVNFGSVVSTGLQPTVNANNVSHTDRIKCSLHAKNNGNNIDIQLSNIPENVVGVSLIREDMNSDSFTYMSYAAPHKVPVDRSGNTMYIITGHKSVINFVDHDVEPFHTYRYRCIFRLMRGPELISLDEEIIKHLRAPTKLPFRSHISNVEVTYSNKVVEQSNLHDKSQLNHKLDPNLIVKFNLDALPIAEGIESIIQLLASSGVSQVFINELQADRSRITDLAAFMVERLNLTTGRRESFGIKMPGIFEDSPETRNKFGISPHIKGTKYQYVAKLCLKSPESLFKKATTTVAAQNPAALDNLSKSLQRSSQRFMSSYGIFPSLPSESEISDFSANDVLLQIMKGQTGDETFTEITVQHERPQIKKISITKTQLGYNAIMWEVSGDMTQIDHFIIYAKFKGVTAPLGVMSMNLNGRMIFHDKKFAAEIGIVEYSVRMMFTDMTLSDAVSQSGSRNESSMPPKLLDKLTNKPKYNIIDDSKRDDAPLRFSDVFAGKRNGVKW